MIHRIPLHRTQQNDRTPLISFQHDKTVRIRIRFARFGGDILFAKDSGPEFHFLVVFAVDSGADVGCGVEVGGGMCVQDGVCGEVVVWVGRGLLWFDLFCRRSGSRRGGE